MKKITLRPAQRFAHLRHVHPIDYLDPVKRFVNDVGRETAKRLNSDKRFLSMLRQNKIKNAGTRMHATANTVGKEMVAAGKAPKGFHFEFEKTLKAGRGGSRADVLARGARQVFEFDWKTTARSALRSVKQAARHANHIQRRFGAKPVSQEAPNWMDMLRADAPEAARRLPRERSPTVTLKELDDTPMRARRYKPRPTSTTPEPKPKPVAKPSSAAARNPNAKSKAPSPAKPSVPSKPSPSAKSGAAPKPTAPNSPRIGRSSGAAPSPARPAPGAGKATPASPSSTPSPRFGSPR